MSVYFLLKLLGVVLFVFWPVVLMAAVGCYLLWVYAKSLKVPATLTSLDGLQKGDIILTGKTSTSHSWPIQLSNVLTGRVENRYWTHAALYRGDGKVWEAQPEGILERSLEDYWTNGYLVTALRHRYVAEESVFDKALEFCAKQQHASYGGLGLIFYTFSTFVPVGMHFLFNNPKVDELCRVDKAYFCSELVADAFTAAGAPLSGYDGWRIKPVDFLTNPLLVPVARVQEEEPVLC